MRRLGFESGRFDGITAFYSLFHVPRDEHFQVLAGFNRVLRPDGILVFRTGTAAWEGIEEFHCTQMFWSHPDPDVTRQLVIDAGFAIVWSEVGKYGGEKQYWIMARKAQSQ